jgi:crotonobetainyl-CoA:carnitine CoA-transferase CaiB-like acyl-CoA transferase
MPSDGTGEQALAGLRVIDLSTVLAGPNCARYLADFGADVIKVERPDTGDSLRNMAWRDPADGEGLWWRFVNRNKRTVDLDLKDAADLDVFLRLVDGADVLVENLRPGVLEKLGLGPDVLLARNPGLVVTRVTGFGQTGPYASRPGFATIAEAMGGVAAISGQPGGDPMMPAFALTDEVTGIVAAFATMVARARPGGGREPARVHLPHARAAHQRVAHPRRTAGTHGLGHPVHGAARRVPVQRREVHRAVHQQRLRRTASDGTPRLLR